VHSASLSIILASVTKTQASNIWTTDEITKFFTRRMSSHSQIHAASVLVNI